MSPEYVEFGVWWLCVNGFRQESMQGIHGKESGSLNIKINIFSVCFLSENGPSRILVQVMIHFVLVVQFWVALPGTNILFFKSRLLMPVMVNKSLKHKDLINKSFNKFIL